MSIYIAHCCRSLLCAAWPKLAVPWLWDGWSKYSSRVFYITGLANAKSWWPQTVRPYDILSVDTWQSNEDKHHCFVPLAGRWNW